MMSHQNVFKSDDVSNSTVGFQDWYDSEQAQVNVLAESTAESVIGDVALPTLALSELSTSSANVLPVSVLSTSSAIFSSPTVSTSIASFSLSTRSTSIKCQFFFTNSAYLKCQFFFTNSCTYF